MFINGMLPFSAFYDIMRIYHKKQRSDNNATAYLSGIVDDDDYKLAELVPVVEVVHVADYLCNPRVSTQHGVKGESHDSVVFVAEDSSNNPCVAMYRFFEMWGQIPISAKTLNQFYYDFAAEVDNMGSMVINNRIPAFR